MSLSQRYRVKVFAELADLHAYAREETISQCWFNCNLSIGFRGIRGTIRARVSRVYKNIFAPLSYALAKKSFQRTQRSIHAYANQLLIMGGNFYDGRKD